MLEAIPDAVIVSIADNGPGIPDDRKEVVFGRGEATQLHHGSGFRLYFLDAVVEEVDGEVWIEDTDPTRSVVKMRLPGATRRKTG